MYSQRTECKDGTQQITSRLGSGKGPAVRRGPPQHGQTRRQFSFGDLVICGGTRNPLSEPRVPRPGLRTEVRAKYEACIRKVAKVETLKPPRIVTHSSNR